jgi:hypothetical protein
MLELCLSSFLYAGSRAHPVYHGALLPGGGGGTATLVPSDTPAMLHISEISNVHRHLREKLGSPRTGQETLGANTN